MSILVTGSAGHLGEALVRTLRAANRHVIGLDIKASPFTDVVGSITDFALVSDCVRDCDAIVHTATLHKPHVGTHSRQDFIDTNVSGTLNLLEAAYANNCRAFIFTSTTSTFGDAMKPAAGEPAVWVTEELKPQPKNIYGVTKTTAEDLCQLFHRNTGMPCLVLKTSRFFPEDDDDKDQRAAFTTDNLKVNELLFRRADIADLVDAHLLALDKARDIGFARMILTATSPFQRDDAAALATDTPSLVAQYFPDFAGIYADRGWEMSATIDRVYDNALARRLLNWEPKYSFASALAALAAGTDYRSPLAVAVGKKGYHDVSFTDGPFPVSGF